MIASIGVAVTLPLLFVAGKRRWLPALAVGALAVNVPLEWLGKMAFGLPGVAVGLAATTVLVLGALLVALSWQTLRHVAIGLVTPTVLMGVLAGLAFLAASRLLPPIPAAVLGLALYAALLAALRPRGLRAAWSYMRALH
jgi:hypothetical protein